MNKLIKNEFKKLFSKKVMYILFVIAIAFIILTNVLYNMDEPYDNSEHLKEEISYLEKELKKLDYRTIEDNQYYIDLKTQYDLAKLQLNYDSESWQYNFISTNEYISNLIININENTYGINKDNNKLKNAQEEYNNVKEKLDLGDWKSFLEEQLKTSKEEIAFYEENLKNIKDKKTIDEINSFLKIAKANKQVLEWRLEKNIPYDNSFLSNKIEIYTNNFQTVNALENQENKTQEEQKSYKDALKQMNLSKYYIENNINLENSDVATRNLLTEIFSEYGIFISIFAIIVAGTIVSNEFQKGTIKLLLTRPFSRNKILFAKYIVSILLIFIFIILFIVLQYIIGGIINGFDIYNTPIIEYDYNTNNIVSISIFKYLLMLTITKLPAYILLSTLAFALSTITMNSAVSIAISILGNMVSDLFNLFIEKVKLLKYFVTANWDLSIYLFGGEGIADGLNLYKSIIICIIYLAIMLITAFVMFKKRDIKNV